MKVEITQFNDTQAVLRLLEPIDQDIFDNAYNGRLFGYLDLWKKGQSTDEQRKHYWALVNDYIEFTGEAKWKVNLNFKALWHMTTESNREPSVARGRMSQKDVAEWLQIIIEFMIDNEVPFNHPTGYVPADVSKMLYKMTMKRMCWITGKPGDIHHASNLVGMGNKRSTHNHLDSTYMCLSREKHQEIHNIGYGAFCDKYHVYAIKLSEENLKELNLL